MTHECPKGLLEEEMLGRVIDRMCRKADKPSHEWIRLRDTLCTMINERGHFKIGALDLSSSITLREQTQTLRHS